MPPAPPNSRESVDSHLCQRCHQPLLLDPSIQNLSGSQYSSIASALPAPKAPSDLPAAAKLAALPPSSRPGAKVWAESNRIPMDTSNRAGGRNVAESFVLLSQSALMPPSSSANATASSSKTHHGVNIPPPQNQQHLVSQLHSILSSHTPISHPLCTECTALLTSEITSMAEELNRERDAYIAFEQSIQRGRQRKASGSGRSARRRQRQAEDGDEGLSGNDLEGDDEEWEELMRRKKQLEDEEEQLTAELEEKERELEEVRREEAEVKQDEERVDREETEYLLAHASLATHLSHLSNQLSTAKTHLLLSRSLLSHLESTNVYNDAFHIGNVPLDSGAGPSSMMVGTINGLRLGGRPTVEWDEINAAWGLVALCLDRIADKVGCVFQTYRIVPLGSYSKVEELPPAKGSYELYASSDLSPARLLQNRRFNHAMVAVLDCLRQLVEFGRRQGKGWAMGNIEIHKDKISSHSIRLPGISSMPLGLPSMSIMGLGSSSSSSSGTNHAGFGAGGRDPARAESRYKVDPNATAEEGWTRACRAVLTVLKRVLIVESEADRSTGAAGTGTNGR
ncbi:hypothetical protein IAU60_002963 [Kwoniella sp. DSM 27419]